CSTETLILFILKKNSRLYLYIDYRGLNKMIIKNHYLLLLLLLLLFFHYTHMQAELMM
ncbi:hypothetical protein BDBG_18076, partial [Blastomyces gilchristii SLH14081]